MCDKGCNIRFTKERIEVTKDLMGSGIFLPNIEEEEIFGLLKETIFLANGLE